MRRSAAVAFVLGAAATAAVVGAAVPFTGSVLSAAGTAAGAVLDGPSSPTATGAVHAAPAATRAAATATATVPAAQLEQARQACNALGGQLVVLDPTSLECSEVPYVGADGATYYTSVPMSYGGAATGTPHTYQQAGTLEECEEGNYPYAPPPQSGIPGAWNQELNLCQPAGAAPPLWSCTIMSDSGTLEVRASLYSGYAASATVNFSDNQQGDRFPPVTYPVNKSGPYTLWEDVPPGDIGASAEPTACTTS